MSTRGGPAVRVPRPQVTPPRVRRRPSTGSLWAIVLVTLVLGGLLVGRLVQLQLLQHEELEVAAAEVSTREVLTPALRGRILAADGTPLVRNAPSSVVTVDTRTLLESPDEGREVVARVAVELGLPVEELWGRTRVCGSADAPPAPSCFSGSPYEPVPIAYDVDPLAALAVLEHPEDFPGVAVATVPVRSYPAPAGVNAAHLLGYLGRPTEQEVAGGRIHAGDLLGRAGLEQVYDDGLRGSPGRTVVTVDPRGAVTGQQSRTDPIHGQDLRTHVDLRVQAAAEQAIAEAVRAARKEGAPAGSAAALVLRPGSGAVLAAASWPSYDPGVWTAGLTQAEYDRLLDPGRGQPLVDRLVSQTYPPASTFKVVSLPAALATGINPDAEYPCPSAVSIGGQRFTNYESRAYGQISLPRIIEVSCDTSFYTWAYDDWRARGGLAQTSDDGDPLVAAASEVGLGRATGIDLPQEAAGTVPSRAWKRAYWEATREESCARAEEGYPEEKDRERREFLEQLARESCVDGWQWRPGDAVNLSIGQGDLAVTPVQLAVVYAAVANGGTLWEPRLAAGWQEQDGSRQETLEPEQAGTAQLDAGALALVRKGLDGVNVDGTGAAAFAGFPLEDYLVAGKTGSAESFGQEATAWYASYGPVPDPEYVVVVMVEQGGIGGEVAAPAARRIWDVLREERP